MSAQQFLLQVEPPALSDVMVNSDKNLYDVTLKDCDGKEVKCHKVFLAWVSPVFNAMFRDTGMVENTSESVVNIEDFDIETIQ